MAEIAHGSVVQTTEQTTTSSTFGNVSGAQIASSNFVVGGVYILLITADLSIASATAQVGVRVTHGGTAFAGAENQYESSNTNRRMPFFWFYLWTAVSGEAIDVQLRSVDNATQARIDTISMVWIRVDADLTTDDYKFNELATDNPLGTTFEAGASITWTPVNANDTWLLMGYQQVSMSAFTSQGEMRLLLVGDTPVGLNSQEGEASGNIYGQFYAYAIVLPASSQTLRVEGRSESANVFTHLHSQVLALRLNVFRNFAQVFTATELDGTATAWADDVATQALTPDVEGDVLAITACIDDYDATGGTMQPKHRLRLDDTTDLPDGQTTHAYSFDALDHDATDQGCMVRCGMANVTAASHTWAHDANLVTAAAGRGYSDRSLVVFTMELPAAPSEPEIPRLVMAPYRAAA